MKRFEGLSFYRSSVRWCSYFGTTFLPCTSMISMIPEHCDTLRRPSRLCKDWNAAVLDNDVIRRSLACRLWSSQSRHGTLQPSSNLLPSPPNTLREMPLPAIILRAFTTNSQRTIRLSYSRAPKKRNCLRERRGRGRCQRLGVAGRYIGLLALIRLRNRRMRLWGSG